MSFLVHAPYPFHSCHSNHFSRISSGNAASLINLKDPEDNIAYEMHQYLDKDGSGTDPICVSATIGAERVKEATEWLQKNGKKGFLGEMGGGSNDQCIAAIKGALCTLQTSGVWKGFLWWSAGPWWGGEYSLALLICCFMLYRLLIIMVMEI